jgi:hypothetical protein
MRKALLMLSLAASLSPSAWAQVLTADQVPVHVKRAFQTKFPAAKSAEWKLKSDKNYEAEFIRAGAEVTVKFDTAGKWLETETQIAQSHLTKAVRDVLANHFSGYKLVETQSVELWNDPGTIFEVHLENQSEILKIQLYADGNILSKSATPKSKP